MIVCDAAGGRTFLVPAARNASPGWMTGIVPRVGTGLGPTAVAALLVLMTIAYGVALACAPAVSGRWPLIAVGAAATVALLGPPLLSADAFMYIAWGRLGVHGIDPYSHPAIAIGHDAVRPFLLWHHGSSPYGPVFTIGTYALAPLGVAAGFWALKGCVAVAIAGCASALWQAAGHLERSQAQAVIAVLLNPLTLVYAIGGVHNDMLMGAAVAAALLAYAACESARVGGWIAAAAMVKASAGLALPFAIAGARDRGGIVRGAAFAGVVLGAAGLVAFGPQVLDIAATFSGQQHTVASHSLPGEIRRLLGWRQVPRWLLLVQSGLLAAAVAGLLLWVARGADWLRATAWAYLAVLLTTAWFLPWYVTWPLPYVALSGDRRLLRAVWGLTLTVIVLRAPQLG